MRLLVVLLAALALAPAAAAMSRSNVAALQVALHARGLYDGAIDGVDGRGTRLAVRLLQRRAHLAVDGVPGPATRRALGRLGRPQLGRRELRIGDVGWDVARLQFLLAWHGFPSGTIDGGFGPHVERAVIQFQRFAHLAPDGKVGHATLHVLLKHAAPGCPIALAWPLHVPIGSPFGPRAGGRFHTGIDLPAPSGTRIHAAARGRVSWAAFAAGGWGNLVVVADGHGVRTLYAHLSRILVHVGERVAVGSPIGLVGATGDATGPHLHFQVNVNGAAVNPVPALRN